VRGNEIVVEIFPDVAVIVIRLVPFAAALPAVSVNVSYTLELYRVTEAGFGDMEAVTPLGKPETERLMLPLKPFWPERSREMELVVP
jgi:hypothetical protein